MRLTLETNDKKARANTSSYNGVMGVRFSRYKYSDAVLLGIFKKIFKRLNMIDYTVINSNPITVGSAKYFLNTKMNIAFTELFMNGFILFQKSKSGKIKYIPKKDAFQTPDGWKYENEMLEIFYSDTFDVFGQSDYMVLKDTLKGIDNCLNASQTVIKRLGAVIVATPEQPTSNPQAISIDDVSKTKLEDDVKNDYGILDEQKQFMFLRRPLKITRIALGGRDLLITEMLGNFVKVLCDAANIPYDVMAQSGQSTFANQEQADKSMQDTAEEFVSKIWVYMNSMGVQFNWVVNNNKYGKSI